ncbi:MAG: response regulator transcription factor [Hespellia sp.]|nr:response regulator transcription factor [Hespellia sp.]
MMIKMIIIDDEAIIREGLKRFIDWQSIGVEICDTASNGMTAMASILNNKPDIILTDIRMPGLDGLDLIQLLKEQDVTSEVIFISAHSNFEYARRALLLGAFDYITKPVDEEELLNTVRRCRDKIETARRTHNIVSSYTEEKHRREQFILSRLLFHKKALTAEETAFLQDKPWIHQTHTGVAAIGLWYDSDDSPRISDELLTELFSENPNYPFLILNPFPEATFIILFSGQSELHSLYYYALDCIHDDFYKRDGMLVTLSEPHPWDGNFIEVYTDCSLVWILHYAGDSHAPFTFRDSFLNTSCEHSLEETLESYLCQPLPVASILPMLKDFLFFHIQDGSIYDLEFMKLQFIRLVDRYVEGLRSYCLHDYLDKNVLSAQKSIAAQTCFHQVCETTYHLFLNIASSMEEISQNTSKQLVRSSLSYIHDHFSEKLTLEKLAEHLYVSPTYLSKILSAELGQPFSKYLQEYRISRAIEYMRDSHDKLYDIASACGFSDVAYFSKIFKTVTGMSPNQYRNKKL